MQGGQTVNCLCEAEMLAQQRIGVPLSLIVGRFSSQCIPPISSDTGPLSWLPVLFESADGKYITARHGNCQLRALSQALNSTVKIWKTKKPPVTVPRCMATAQFVCGRHIFIFFSKSESHLPASLCSACSFSELSLNLFPSPPCKLCLCLSMDIPERFVPTGSRSTCLSLSLSIRECGGQIQTLADNTAKSTLAPIPSDTRVRAPHSFWAKSAQTLKGRV